ncbi:MAG: alginate export family protein [Planctomycetota bacterium]
MSRALAGLVIPALCCSPIAQAGKPAQVPPPTPATIEATDEGTVIRIPGMKSLTISGQYRIRWEDRIDFDFNDNGGVNEDFFTQRVRLNLAPEFTETLSAFIQLQDAREWGEELSTLDDSADGLDLHQAFVLVDEFPYLSGTGKIGRQEAELGEQRLISSLQWATQARAFSGYRHTWWTEDRGLSIDGFFFQTAEMPRNGVNDDAFFAGVYGSGFPGEDTVIDVYALHLDNRQTMAGGTEQRTTFGTRFVQQISDFELGIEVATQVGEVNGADIPIGDTYAGHARAAYRPRDIAGKPWIQAELNLASGNRPGTSDNERFNGLFAFAHKYWGYMDLAQWENLQHASVQAGFKPGEKSTLAVFWHSFRAMEPTDRFGGPNGNLSTGAAGQSRDMGHEIDVQFVQELETAPLVSFLEAGYGVFIPGSGTEQAQGANDLAHFAYVQADFRF